MENETGLRALAAMHDGSAQGLHDFVYLTDNGHLRPAVVLGGHLRRGAHLTLGEDNSFTHVGLVPSTLRHDGLEVEFRRIALGLEDGTLDAGWLAVLQDALVDILLAMRYMLDPQAFIIDGPPATTGPAELESLRERLAERTTIGDAPLILTDQRGQDATLHGALTLALRDVLHHDTAGRRPSDSSDPRPARAAGLVRPAAPTSEPAAPASLLPHVKMPAWSSSLPHSFLPAKRSAG